MFHGLCFGDVSSVKYKGGWKLLLWRKVVCCQFDDFLRKVKSSRGYGYSEYTTNLRRTYSLAVGAWIAFGPSNYPITVSVEFATNLELRR